MAELFDPYSKWLGIPPDQQPPNPYRLLGIELFEADAEVIDHAADRLMGHLRTFQGGEHREDCQRLLNEVSSARISLLDEQRRGAIDRRLRAQLAAKPPGRRLKVAKPLAASQSTARPARPIPVSSPPPSSVAVAPRAAEVANSAMSDRLRGERAAKKNLPREIAKVAAGALAGLTVAVLVLNFALGIDVFGVFGAAPATATSNPDSNGPNPTAPDSTLPINDPAVAGPTDPGGNVPKPAEPSPFQPLPDVGSNTGGSEPSSGPDSPMPDTAKPDGGKPDGAGPAELFFGIRGQAPTTASDLRRSLQQVRAMVPVFDQALGDDRPEDAEQQTRMVHDAFCQLAAVLAVCDYSRTEVREQNSMVNEVLNAVADRRVKFEAIGRLAANRIGLPKQHGRGLFAAGRVVEIEGQSRLYRTRVELAAPSANVVDIYTWRDPATLVSVGDSVFALGMVVENPSKNLAGFVGQSPEPVVWGGFLMRLTPG